MGVNRDFSYIKFEDGVLSTSIAPPVAIGGWSLQFELQHRFGGISGLILKTCASGYGGGQSGITINNSGAGIFSIAINSVDTSGLEEINYAYTISRTDSGFRTQLTQGFCSILPAIF